MTTPPSPSNARYQIPDWFLECNVKTAADLSAAPDQIVLCNCASCKKEIADDYGSDEDSGDEECPDKAERDVEEDGHDAKEEGHDAKEDEHDVKQDEVKESDDSCGSSLGREPCTDKIKYSTFAELRDMTAAALVTDRGGRLLRPEASAVVFCMEREDTDTYSVYDYDDDDEYNRMVRTRITSESCMEPVWMGRTIERVAKALGVSLVALDFEDLEELGGEFYRQDKEAQRCNTAGDAAIPSALTSERREGDAEDKQDGSTTNATSMEEGGNKHEEPPEAADVESCGGVEANNEEASINQRQWEPDVISLSVFLDHFFAARAKRNATAESWERTQVVWSLIIDAVRNRLVTEIPSSDTFSGVSRPKAVIFHIIDYRSRDDNVKRRVLARFAGMVKQRRKQGDAVVMVVSTQDSDLSPGRRWQRKIGATKDSTTVASYVKIDDADLTIRQQTYNGAMNARALRHCLRVYCGPIFPADLLKATADWACAERDKSLRGFGRTTWTSEDMSHIVIKIMGRAWAKPEMKFSDIRAVLKRLGLYNPVEPETKRDAPACSEKAESQDNDESNTNDNPFEDVAGNPSEENRGNTPDDNTGNPSEDIAGNPSEDNGGNAPEDNTGNPSEDNAGNPSEGTADNASEDNRSEANTDVAPDDITDATSVDNQSVDNQSEANTDIAPEDTPGDTSEDTTAVKGLSEVLQGLDLNFYEKELSKCIVDSGTLNTRWDDVILDEESKELMQQLFASNRVQFDCESEFLRQVLRIHGGFRGALLYGPPGTGKTHLGRAVATASGSRMLSISPCDIIFSATGESERYIAGAFTLASKLHPCVLFLDEADSLFYRRSSSDKSWERSQTNQLLNKMDSLMQNEKAPLVLVATNRPWDLDDAFLRRLQHKVYLGLPDIEARARILRLFLHQGDLETVDIDGLALVTGKYSGSDLKALCAKAGLLWEAEQARFDTLYKSVSEKFAMATKARKKVQLGIDHFVKALYEIQPTNKYGLGEDLQRFLRKHKPTASTSGVDPGIRFVYNSSTKRHDRFHVRALISRPTVSDDVPALKKDDPQDEMQLQTWRQLNLHARLVHRLLIRMAILLFFSQRIFEHHMQLQDWCQMDLRIYITHRLHTNFAALLFCLQTHPHFFATIEQAAWESQNSAKSNRNTRKKTKNTARKKKSKLKKSVSTALDSEDSTATGSNSKPQQKPEETSRNSAPEAAHFSYTTLGQDEFRLLKIAPGKNDAPLECTLKNTSFHSDEWYFALSYTWGSPEPPFFIKCDGSDIRITRSLHEALHKLRRTWRPVLVWADAICINQSDNSEKARQVVRMREIYAKANRLFIWLGNPATASDADVAVKALGKLEEYNRSIDPLSRSDKKTLWTRAMFKDIWQKMDQAEARAMSANEWLQLRNFFQMPWFSRVWIFQEVASVVEASQFNILVGYGNRIINWLTVHRSMGVPASFGPANPLDGRRTNAFAMHQELEKLTSCRRINIYFSEDGKNEERVTEALARKSPPINHAWGAFGPDLEKACTHINIVIDLCRLAVKGSSSEILTQPNVERDASTMSELVLNLFSDEFRAVGETLMEEVHDMSVDALALSAIATNVKVEDGNDAVWWLPGHPLFLGLRATFGFVAALSVKHHRGQSAIITELKTATFSFMPDILDRMWSRLQLARRLEATDLRDKVYAFLSMFGEDVEDEPLLKVDYNLSVNDVYINLTIYFLQRLMCLDVLEFVNDMPTRKSRLGNLPSWAIDLTSPTDLDLLSLSKDVNAGGSLSIGQRTNFPMFPMHVLQVNVSNDRRRLDLNAFLVGEVTELGLLPHHYVEYDYLTGKLHRDESEADDNIARATLRTYSLVLDMINNLGQSTRNWNDVNVEDPHASPDEFSTSETFSMPSRLYLTGQRMLEVFWRCLASHCDSMEYQTEDEVGPSSPISQDESEEETDQVYRYLADLLLKGHIPLKTIVTDGHRDAAPEPSDFPDADPSRLSPTAALFICGFMRTSVTRVFGVVADELIGWFPRRAQTGDMLAILPGARCPYVLRRVQRDLCVDCDEDANEDDAAQAQEQRSEWEVIGFAYVEGLMRDIVTEWRIDLTEKGKELLGKLSPSGEPPQAERICLV